VRALERTIGIWSVEESVTLSDVDHAAIEQAFGVRFPGCTDSSIWPEILMNHGDFHHAIVVCDKLTQRPRRFGRDMARLAPEDVFPQLSASGALPVIALVEASLKFLGRDAQTTRRNPQ
jgi:hypothetical protein